MLEPYLKSEQLLVCPSAYKISTNSSTSCDPPKVFPNGVGAGSYGYNYQYLGRYIRNTTTNLYEIVDVSLAAVGKPAETVMITEISGLAGLGSTMRPTDWAVANTSTCDTSAVKVLGNQNGEWHNQDGSNIVFVDGHSKWMRWDALRDYDGNGTTDNLWYWANK